jgi:hypothetical protein
MPDENIQAMVDNAFSDNPSEMKAAFYNAINDRVFDALQQRKQEMAKNFITQYDTEEEETEEPSEEQEEQDETTEQ